MGQEQETPTPAPVALRELPPGSLGREYARFLDANRITPLAVSPDIKQRFRENPFVLRYTATHDLHHCLLGFDAGLAGEAGVYAFTVAQGAAPGGRAMLWTLRVLYALFSPPQARRIWHNIRVGLRQGRAAKLVIAEPHAAGVLASRASVIARLAYGAR